MYCLTKCDFSDLGLNLKAKRMHFMKKEALFNEVFHFFQKAADFQEVSPV